MQRWVINAALLSPMILVAYAMAGGGVGDASWLGITVEQMSRSEEANLGIPANDGVVVVVAVEGTGLEYGVMTRDVVVAVNGRPVDSTSSFLTAGREAMRARRGDGTQRDVVLGLRRFGRPLAITVPAEVVTARGGR